ncbi:hypothetical protein BD310DRAFT_232219 [Dichomitus squalens]|uniref:Uncharacterized protein n=1 Tax=Dichomitus squalens TaxID=114155 RepID=A0A4Q9PE64_9APHY|nr:hypothetical protein BD310DRAFT_232219 [Dichomitus squalens]
MSVSFCAGLLDHICSSLSIPTGVTLPLTGLAGRLKARAKDGTLRVSTGWTWLRHNLELSQAVYQRWLLRTQVGLDCDGGGLLQCGCALYFRRKLLGSDSPARAQRTCLYMRYATHIGCGAIRLHQVHVVQYAM